MGRDGAEVGGDDFLRPLGEPDPIDPRDLDFLRSPSGISFCKAVISVFSLAIVGSPVLMAGCRACWRIRGFTQHRQEMLAGTRSWNEGFAAPFG